MIHSAFLGHPAEVTDPVRRLCQQLSNMKRPAAADVGLGGGEAGGPGAEASLPANTLWIFCRAGDDPTGIFTWLSQAATGAWGEGSRPGLSRRFVDMASLTGGVPGWMVDMAGSRCWWDMGAGGAQAFHTPGDRGHHSPGVIRVPERLRVLVSTCSPPPEGPQECPSSIWQTLDLATLEDPTPGLSRGVT